MLYLDFFCVLAFCNLESGSPDLLQFFREVLEHQVAFLSVPDTLPPAESLPDTLLPVSVEPSEQMKVPAMSKPQTSPPGLRNATSVSLRKEIVGGGVIRTSVICGPKNAIPAPTTEGGLSRERTGGGVIRVRWT